MVTRIKLTAIRPKRRLNAAGAEKMFNEGLKEEAEKQLVLFKKTTSSWKAGPDLDRFSAKKSNRHSPGPEGGGTLWGLPTKKELEKFKGLPEFEISPVKRIALDYEIHTGALKSTEMNRIYAAINHGTKERTIRPKARMLDLYEPGHKVLKPLRFKQNYTPATSKAKPFSPGRPKRSGDWVTTYLVKNKISPREFDVAVARKRKGFFIKVMRNKMKKFRIWI